MHTYTIKPIPCNNAYGVAYQVWQDGATDGSGYVGTFTRKFQAEAWIDNITWTERQVSRRLSQGWTFLVVEESDGVAVYQVCPGHHGSLLGVDDTDDHYFAGHFPSKEDALAWMKLHENP